jgi:hypothetical protein
MSDDQGKDPRRVEAGKKAAETTKERYGENFHSEIGHKGGEARSEQLQGSGSSTMSGGSSGGGGSDSGSGGGQGRGRNLSSEEASELGKKGAEARWGKQ